MRIFSFLMLVLLPIASFSNVIVSGTRIIYPAEQKEVNINLSNVGTKPSLVQVWIEDEKAETNKPIPFVLTPPLSRIDANKKQTLRLIYTKEPLPKDRESLFYFHLLDIPPKPKSNEISSENYLQISLTSRLKLFFRPANLKPHIDEAPKKLQVKLQKEQLAIHNPTPYYITITQIYLLTNKHDKNPFAINGTTMIKPFDNLSIPTGKYQGNFSVATIETVNDIGATINTELPLSMQ